MTQAELAMAIIEEAIGTRTGHYPLARMDRAQTLWEACEFMRAGREAVATEEDASTLLTPNHPLTAVFQNELASMLEGAGIQIRAHHLHTEAIERSRAAHPYSGPRRIGEHLGVALDVMRFWARHDRAAEARELLHELQSDIATWRIPNTFAHALLLVTRAEVLAVTSDAEGALADLRALDDVLDSGELIEGRIALPLIRAGRLFRELGEYEDAERILARAFEILSEHLLEDSPHFAELFQQCGNVHLVQGQIPEAGDDLELALRVKQSAWGESHPATLEILRDYASYCEQHADDATQQRIAQLIHAAERQQAEMEIAAANGTLLDEDRFWPRSNTE